MTFVLNNIKMRQWKCTVRRKVIILSKVLTAQLTQCKYSRNMILKTLLSGYTLRFSTIIGYHSTVRIHQFQAVEEIQIWALRITTLKWSIHMITNSALSIDILPANMRPFIGYYFALNHVVNSQTLVIVLCMVLSTQYIIVHKS